MDTYSWYGQLIKPFWSPPAWLFGPVWTILYLVIFISFGKVVYLYWRRKISAFVLLPFVLNVIFNLAFTPIQFGLKNNYLAMIDILLVFMTLIWTMVKIYPINKVITYLQVPYLVWVSFATVLQVTITYLNR